MTTPIVEGLELFSEAQLESLEFLPEELENIEFELYPNLESISPEQVAKDLEAYFEGGLEEAGLEALGRSRGFGRGRSSTPGDRTGGIRGRFSRGGRSSTPSGRTGGIRGRFRRGGRSGAPGGGSGAGVPQKARTKPNTNTNPDIKGMGQMIVEFNNGKPMTGPGKLVDDGNGQVYFDYSDKPYPSTIDWKTATTLTFKPYMGKKRTFFKKDAEYFFQGGWVGPRLVLSRS
jgi:hypothetical protein